MYSFIYSSFTRLSSRTSSSLAHVDLHDLFVENWSIAVCIHFLSGWAQGSAVVGNSLPAVTSIHSFHGTTVICSVCLFSSFTSQCLRYFTEGSGSRIAPMRAYDVGRLARRVLFVRGALIRNPIIPSGALRMEVAPLPVTAIAEKLLTSHYLNSLVQGLLPGSVCSCCRSTSRLIAIPSM